jgi:hypothetical protein
VEKNNLLINEVGMLRSALLQYKILNHRNPETLKQLTTDAYTIDGKSHPFLEKLSMNQEGKAVDPFGHIYAYDAKSGWVASTTPGCERW